MQIHMFDVYKQNPVSTCPSKKKLGGWIVQLIIIIIWNIIVVRSNIPSTIPIVLVLK